MSQSQTALAVVGPVRSEAALAVPSLSMPILDVYAPDGVAQPGQLRFDALATISAGQKGDNGVPFATKDGTIALHDPELRAPGLAQALALTQYKRLTIAFPSDDPTAFIQQRFTEYSASALLSYGDATGITCITGQGDAAQHNFHPAGSPGFKAALARCKVSVSVYFHLAEWGDDGPAVTFPDGLGLYRWRFTSRNSLRNLMASLDTIMRYTGGRLAGLPLEVSLTYREVPAPNGKRRKVVVWSCLMKPPQKFSFNSKTFRDIANKSLAEGAALMLAAPPSETLEMALQEGPDADLDSVDDAVASAVESGSNLCDARHYEKTWFAVVKGTDLDSEEGRADFLAMYTSGKCDSLAEFLKGASDDDAAALIESARKEMRVKVLTDGTGQVIAEGTGEILSDTAPAGPQATYHIDPDTSEIIWENIHLLDDDALKRHVAYLKDKYPKSVHLTELRNEWARRYPPAPSLDAPASPGVMTNGPKAPAPGPGLYAHVESKIAGSTTQSAEDAEETERIFGQADEVTEGEVVENDDAENALLRAGTPAPAVPAGPAPKVKKTDAWLNLFAVLDEIEFDRQDETLVLTMLNWALEQCEYPTYERSGAIPVGQLVQVTHQIRNRALDPNAWLAELNNATG